MTTQNVDVVPTSMQELLDNATLDAGQRKFLIGVMAATAWSRVCALKSGAGASTATRLLGKVAGFNKGTAGKVAITMLETVSKSAVELAITEEEDKKVKGVQEKFDAGEITDEQATKSFEQIAESYANARAWLNTLDIVALVKDFKFIREHRNTINVTIKTSKAVGARVTVTIDETISEFLGKPIKNSDVAKACEQGLARFE